MVNLSEGGVLLPLKGALVHLFLKEPSLNPIILENFCPESNFPFLGKLVEKMIVQQLQKTLDEQIWKLFSQDSDTGME